MQAGDSPSEHNYSITELETLAVVWAISHFHYYLYNQSVTVYTDHSAVKAILGSPNLSGKHAWLNVYSSGVGNIEICYCSGKANGNTDALSRWLLSECQEATVHGIETDGELDIGELFKTEP